MKTQLAAKHLYSIGDVIDLLGKDFPDLSISKIRFLESEGLIQPLRAPSGYRKFSTFDLNRIRYILELQNKHYLPLRVIKEHLELVDSGAEEVISLPKQDSIQTIVQKKKINSLDKSNSIPAKQHLTKIEFLAACEIEEKYLNELINSGLIEVQSNRFSSLHVPLVRACFRLQNLGVPTKHLRSFKLAAEREVSLAEAIAKPVRDRKGQQSSSRADELIIELINEFFQLRAAIITAKLNSDLS
jgi:DNA-binding transcriptional MerR regulator